jgi:hypothetical protein
MEVLKVHSPPMPPAVSAGQGREARQARLVSENASTVLGAHQAKRASSLAAAMDASGRILTNWMAFRSRALAVVDLADRNLAIYSATVMRRHPKKLELSRLRWSPNGLVPPDWVHGLRPDLQSMLDELDVIVLQDRRLN